MKSGMKQTAGLPYEEHITSIKTEAVFVVLALLFGWLFVRKARGGQSGVLPLFLFIVSAFFIFYAINYRTLKIQLNRQALSLSFGMFTWIVPVADIVSCEPDHLPLLLRMGGAGIHFMSVGNRYRVSFNFLEYPRVVVGLKHKQGLVQDVSFSTRRPDELLGLLQHTNQLE